MKTLVLPTFKDRQLGLITSEQIEKWIGGLVAKGYSPSTVHKAAQLLSGVLRSAVRARRLAVNPAGDVDLPTIERPERAFLTTEQIVALADAIDPRYRCMVLLGGFAGLRLGEVCALRASSFGVGLRTVTITETVSEVRGQVSIGPPKTRASIRTVALPAFLGDELPKGSGGSWAARFGVHRARGWPDSSHPMAPADLESGRAGGRARGGHVSCPQTQPRRSPGPARRASLGRCQTARPQQR